MTKSKPAKKSAPAKKAAKPAKYIQEPALPGITPPTPPLSSEQARRQLRGF